MNAAIAIAGVTPREVVTPGDLDELVQIVRGLHADRKAFAFVGGCSELELGNAPRALDTVVRTTSLTRVVDYTPEDQTITVEAGMTFAELDRILGEHGQMLPLDVVDRERSTVGGVVATNAYGKRRQRYGTAKDLIVGVTIVRPDGVVARGGGKVVKNVAGFDLPKLMVGSLGTLGAIATVTLRLYPLPDATRTLVLAATSGDDRSGDDALARIPRALVAQRLEPESVTAYAVPPGRALVVTFAGTRAGVDAQCAALREIAAVGRTGVSEATAEDVHAFDAIEHEVRTDGAWRVQITATPAAPSAPAALQSRTGPFRGVRGRVAYPLLGVARDAFEAPLADLRRDVAASTRGTGSVVVHAMPAADRARVDAWPPCAEPTLSLMRAIKHNFDPLDACNPGRFVGGL